MTLVNGTYLFSNSEITTFQGCPRKWWLAWYRGLAPKQQAVQGPMSTGTRVHIALAGYYTPLNLLSPRSYAMRLLEEIQHDDITALRAQYADDEDLELREKKLYSDFDLERIMVEGYLDWIAETGIDADLEIVGVEQYVEADFPVSNIEKAKLIGKVDARVKSRITGRRKFIDHKTVQSLRDPTLKMNRQMLHYHLLEELTTAPNEERCDGALYNMLRKVKRTAKAVPPFFGRIPIDHNKHQILSYRIQIERLIRDILDRTYALNEGQDPLWVAPARPSRECGWCPFMKVCTMFDDGSRVEAALEDLYEVRDPLSYYGAREKESDEIS